MTSKNFLAKKSWHTGAIKHMEKVWKAEQRDSDEKKKTEILKRELAEERRIDELRKIADESAGKKHSERLDWMYTIRKPSSEDYLKGSAKKEEEKELETLHKNPGSLWNGITVDATKDAEAKIRDDPLLNIMAQKQKSIQNIVNNPVQMKKIRSDDKLKKKLKKLEKKQKKLDKKLAKEESRSSEKGNEDERESLRSRQEETRRGRDSKSPSRSPVSKRRKDSESRSRSPIAKRQRSSPNRNVREEERRDNERREDNRRESDRRDYDRRDSNRRDDDKRDNNRRDDGDNRKYNARRDDDRRRDDDDRKDNDRRIGSRDDDRRRDSDSRKNSDSRKDYDRRDNDRKDRDNRRDDDRKSNFQGNNRFNNNRNRNVKPKMSEEERQRRLAEMISDAQTHEERKYKQIQHLDQVDEVTSTNENANPEMTAKFIDNLNTAVYSKSDENLADRVKRNIHFLQRNTGDHLGSEEKGMFD